ncbi:MAG TPA: hypothetical protein VID74_01700 [Gemmatimonadales bacterium]|jgi:hypothetical protein
MPPRPRSVALLMLAAACTRVPGSASCGIQALTRPLAVKQSFAEGNVLTAVPGATPATVVVRLVAGPAWRGTVAAEGSGWRVTTHGAVSGRAHVGYGVLVLDFHDAPLGVLAFDGHAVAGAPTLGMLAIGDTVVPLLGVRVDPQVLQDSRCPVFPDSLR